MKSKVIRTAIFLFALAAAAAIALRVTGGETSTFDTNDGDATAGARSKNASKASGETLVAAPGVIEPVSEEIELGAEMPGKIKEVTAEEGDRVARGQVLAVLEKGDYAAQVASSESQIASSEAQALAAAARLEQARAELRRVVNGARAEERREARASVEQALAVARNAQSEVGRRRTLFADGDISREELERAERDADVAAARERELRERFGFVDASAREEDVARAQATVRLSEAQVIEARARIGEARAGLAEARARLDKSYIRSPIAGVILRKRLRVGESVSPESPNNSIFTVADTSALRVRVDVDERDVGRVTVGQRAYVTADAYGDHRFGGRVASVGQVLGRKNVRTEEPTEQVDKKILETIVALDGGQRLPPGLRVDAFIIVDAQAELQKDQGDGQSPKRACGSTPAAELIASGAGKRIRSATRARINRGMASHRLRAPYVQSARDAALRNAGRARFEHLLVQHRAPRRATPALYSAIRQTATTLKQEKREQRPRA